MEKKNYVILGKIMNEDNINIAWTYIGNTLKNPIAMGIARAKERFLELRFGCGNCNSDKIYDSIEKAKGRSSLAGKWVHLQCAHANGTRCIVDQPNQTICTRLLHFNNIRSSMDIPAFVCGRLVKCHWQKINFKCFWRDMFTSANSA